jgi:CheY-like chemotaxis protein
MHVIILEDDFLQAEWIQGEVLHQHFRGMTSERIATEHAFRNRLDALRATPPSLVLIDVMMRWTDPDSDATAPEEIANDGYYRAGLRCERLLRSNKETSNVPVILYTVLDRIDLDSDLQNLHPMTRYIEKNSDPTELVNAMNELLAKKEPTS